MAGHAGDEVAGQVGEQGRRLTAGETARLLVSPRWLVRHLLLVAALVVCWLFFRWQLGRAVERHSILNWSYTVEWALFAAFSVLCWGWFLRDEVRNEPEEPDEAAPGRTTSVAPQVSDEDDPELAAYNRMLAELHRKATS